MSEQIIAKQALPAKISFIDWLTACPVKAIRNDELSSRKPGGSEEINYSFYVPYG